MKWTIPLPQVIADVLLNQSNVKAAAVDGHKLVNGYLLTAVKGRKKILKKSSKGTDVQKIRCRVIFFGFAEFFLACHHW